MASCWAAAPKDRPSFKDIVRSITILLWLDDEHESAHDNESAVEETSFSRFDERSRPGGRLNKKDRLTGYGDSHVKDKTSYRPSYL